MRAATPSRCCCRAPRSGSAPAWSFGQARPYAAPLAAIILSAWFGGFRPALLAVALAILAINTYQALTDPQGWGMLHATQAAVFAGITLLIAAFARARETSNREARRQAARLEAMFGQASLGISLLSLDGRLTRVNRRMADIIGRSIEDTIGLTCEQITHPDDWPSHARLIEKVAGGALNEIAIDKRYLRPDGSSVWVHVSMAPLLDGDGEPEGLIAIVEDIAERHEAEDRLRASENRYRSLVDASMAIVWTADAAGGFTPPQESWEASTGQDASRYAGWGWCAAVHPEDRERVQAAVARRAGQPAAGRHRERGCGTRRRCPTAGTPRGPCRAGAPTAPWKNGWAPAPTSTNAGSRRSSCARARSARAWRSRSRSSGP